MCIDDVDKNGVALGRLYVLSESSTSKKVSKSAYALMLVAAGLARVDARHAAEKPSSEVTDLQEAQALALAEKRAMWSIPETVAEEEQRQSGGRGRDIQNEDGYIDEMEEPEMDISRMGVSGGARTKGPSLRGDEERVAVRLCEITDGVTFFVHIVSESRSKLLQAVEQQMVAYAATRPAAGELGASAPAPLETKKGQLVLALFDDRSGSGPVWFRAKVEEVEVGGKKARVQFIDYGNRAIVSMSEIASVESPSSSSASKSTSVYFAQAPLAIECSLAFLSPPSEAEDRNGDGLIRAAGLSLGDLTWDRDLSMQILGREYATGKLLVALYDDIVHEAKAEDGDDAAGAEAEKSETSENVFDGEGEESRKKRAALSLSQRVLSVNELLLMDGLARISRSSTRMLPKVPVPGRGANKSDRALSSLAASLLVHLEESQEYARRAHVSLSLQCSFLTMYPLHLESRAALTSSLYLQTNLFRYGDPADSDEERENDREKEREKKDRDAKAK